MVPPRMVALKQETFENHYPFNLPLIKILQSSRSKTQ